MPEAMAYDYANKNKPKKEKQKKDRSKEKSPAAEPEGMTDFLNNVIAAINEEDAEEAKRQSGAGKK